MTVRNDYEVAIPFDEVGLKFEGASAGSFMGEAHLDADGNVVGLILDAYEETVPGVPPKAVLRYLPVPACYAQQLSFHDRFAQQIAFTIARDYEIEIVEALAEWRAALAEPDPDQIYEARRDEPEFYR